ncbi:unnamed protein product [Tuber melanosporum]|uniref:(Perigord truffle) hypothetical protein n=1 Tax=Tuber melanosporum (strain Mel28) TaxID=656061 RepID=D5GMT9_TUBMM|nr:uncharacterized protein GSTUM_00010929001 [Tuber melanosporum]CAZ85832.1 unnamed protein product [Tuber melanosporum]
MESPRGSCPSGYNWYVCALSTYNGCCRIDPCSLPQGCPPDAQFSSTLPGGTGTIPSPNPGTSATRSPSATVKTSSTSPVSPTVPPVSGLDPTSSSPVHTSTPAFSTSGTASSALPTSAGSNSGGNSKDTNPVPQAVIVGATIGGVLIILIIILIIMLCRRRRESKNSANDLPNYDSEPSPGDGAVRGISNPAPSPTLNSPPLTESHYSGAQWLLSPLHTNPPDVRRQSYNNAN